MLDKVTATLIWAGVWFALACNDATRAPGPEPTGPATKPEGQRHRERSFEFLTVSEGLLSRHAGLVPLLEKVACIPPIEPGQAPSCNTQRVYGDGDLYMLTDNGTEAWLHLAKLEPGTTAKLEDLFAELCDGEDPVMGNDNGRFTYRVSSEKCTREFVVIGLPQGSLERIGSVNDIINGAIVPGTSEASAAGKL